MQFKHTLQILALFILHSSLVTLPAAVPLRWTVETSRAQVAQFESYRGETLLLEATMQSYGSPLETPVQPSLYWQTNGMGAAWWTAPATASGNVLRATWSPTNDFGGSTLIELNASPWNMRSSVFVSRAVIVSLSFIRRTISIRLVPLTVGSPQRAAS